MVRFIMPDPAIPLREQKEILLSQFDRFLCSDALQEPFEKLHVDRSEFSVRYNGRLTAEGGVREMPELEPNEELESVREDLYPLLQELGFMDINKPLYPENSHILVLSGSLRACRDRTRWTALQIGPSTRSVDGLACFRPVNPIEREHSSLL